MSIQSWEALLTPIREQDYYQPLMSKVSQAREQHTVYPAEEDVFNAFKLTDYQNLKVVIIGQDPYHGPNQAHGLSFSVKKGVPIPPSLKNIFKELHQDLNLTIPPHGDLTAWTKQGVLLLNSTLTVNQGAAHSHAGFGWQQFTRDVIKALNPHPNPIAFLLWGAHAQKIGVLIQHPKHTIFKAPHPSPLSAYRGFLGCQHFSKVNQWLVKQNHKAINWAI